MGLNQRVVGDIKTRLRSISQYLDKMTPGKKYDHSQANLYPSSSYTFTVVNLKHTETEVDRDKQNTGLISNKATFNHR